MAWYDLWYHRNASTWPAILIFGLESDGCFRDKRKPHDRILVPDCPVKTDNPAVICTVYKKDKLAALISIASWANRNPQRSCPSTGPRLHFAHKPCWPLLKLRFSAGCYLYSRSKFPSTPGAKGWLLILKENKRHQLSYDGAAAHGFWWWNYSLFMKQIRKLNRKPGSKQSPKNS